MEKKRILVAEVLYPNGHKQINKKYIECLSKSYEIVLLDSNGYFSNINQDLIKKRVNIRSFKSKRIEFLKTYCNYLNMINIAKIAKLEKCEAIVMLTFHVRAFSKAYPFFKDLHLSVVHHNDLDRMTLFPKEVELFNRFKNKIHHIVLEDFIRIGFIDKFNVNPNLVFTIPEPVEPTDVNQGVIHKKNENLFIGIGQSTDEKLIEELVGLDKSGRICSNLKGKIILRSKRITYKGNHVEVFTGYLSNKEYDDLYNKATACIIKYEPTFELRASGSLNDAFRNHKVVIVSGFPAGKLYSNVYPHNCILCQNTAEIFSLLNCKTMEFDSCEGAMFFKAHSSLTVAKEWQHAIDSPY